jgi:hypothetical protein
MSYEWIIGDGFAHWEVRTAYNKYIKARKSSDFHWFYYWLDYLQIRNRYNEK